MAHQSVIFLRFEGKQVPENYYEKIKSHFKTSVGYAWADDDGTVAYGSENKPLNIKGLREIEEGFANKTIVFSLGNYESDFLEEDLQPIPVIEGDEEGEQPALVAFLDGDFPAFTKPESNHSPAYYVVQDALVDECLKIYNKGGRNLDKLMEDVSGPEFRKFLQEKVIGSRGEIILFAGNGKFVVFQKNNQMGGEFTWGRTSNKLDYTEALGTPPAASVPGVKGKQSAADRLAALKTGAKVPDTAGVEAPKGVSPPPDYASQKQINNWYKRHRADGKIPEDAASKPIIPYAELAKDSPLQPSAKSLQEAAAVVAQQQQQAPGVRTLSEPPPIIPAPILDEIMKKFIPNISLVDDPGKIVELEKEYPTFEEKTKIPLEQIVLWRFKTRRELCKTYPQAAAVLMRDICAALVKADPSLLSKKPGEKKTGEDRLAALEKKAM